MSALDESLQVDDRDDPCEQCYQEMERLQAELKQVTEAKNELADLFKGYVDAAREREAKAFKDTIERCAKICDAKADGIIEESWDDGYNTGAYQCAGTIRALTTQET